MKKITSIILALTMLIAYIPCISIAQGTQSVIDAQKGKVLFSCPDGSFNDTAVGQAFSGWTSTVNAGKVNVKTYDEGNTLQFYTGGYTDIDAEVISPGYAQDMEKVIIEWKMRHSTADDLYFDFSFKDTQGNEIAFLKLDRNAENPGDSHPKNDDIYALGFPDNSTECAIVAYNNPDGATHTVEYYTDGELVYTQSSLDGAINGFKSINASGGYWSAAFAHIGFANLTIGYFNEETIADEFQSIDLPEKITKIYDEAEAYLPESATVTTALGRQVEASVTWEKANTVFPVGDATVKGVAAYEIDGEAFTKDVSIEISILPYTFTLSDSLLYCSSKTGDITADFPMDITGEFYLSYYFLASDMRNCWVYISKDGALWSEGQIGIGTSDASTSDTGYFKAMVSDTEATLTSSKEYYMLVYGNVKNKTYSLTVTDLATGQEVCRVENRSFRKAADVLNTMKLSVNGYGGSFCTIYPRVYYKTYEESKTEYTIVTIKDGKTTTTTGTYASADEITMDEIEGYSLTRTIDGTTVTFVYERLVPCSVTFVNAQGDEIAKYEGDSNEAFTVEEQEIFSIASDGSGAFYKIPKTEVTSVGMKVEVSQTENKYAVTEDAFVQDNTLYGIKCTNADGVMIGSCSDENRGPEKDANGETTYLEGATPTTLGATRVALMKFHVMDIGSKEKATLKFYVKNWHQQGFNGGNTFLRIAVTPLADSSWAEQSEGSAFTIASEPLLDGWNTPVFSEKALQSDDCVAVDVTEIIHAAKAAGLDSVSLKLQIYWGAAYCVEREAAATDGSYAGKAAYIEIEKDNTLSKVTTSGSATLTKNGSAMNGFAYVTPDDDVRLQFDGAYAIGADSGYYIPNESIVITEDTSITETVPLGFGLTMVPGAQVRYGGGLDEQGKVGAGNGLRFITTVNRSDTLAGLENAEIGVIVTAEGSSSQMVVKAEKWQDGTTFTSAITDIAESNYNRVYTATPYVTVGGRTFTGEAVSRSIYQVASGLLVHGDTDNTQYDETTRLLFDVLNAYVNQVGIRLTFSDNEDFTDWIFTANTDGKGSYTGDAFFEVGETLVDGKVYSVTLTPLGENTLIKDNWNNYIRINNNNSQTKLYTTLSANEDGTYTLSFDISGLNMGTYPEERFKAMKPTYDGNVKIMETVNSYWQSNNSYIDWSGSSHPAFWDKAAYHTGNIEMYKLTGDKSYLQYSIDWANYNSWQGNNSTSDPSNWTWGYSQTQGSNAVLFGDWQICFQTYIDLYDMGVDGATLDRVYQVIDYQISKDNDDFWWWADALYMVMPVMTKLYKQTEDEKYLDALYKYFKYAKELMYDGPGGIPTSEDGYTTSAALNAGASYSDPDDYKYLFYRDGGYVYPLSPNYGHENEKNFWARGNGWVFAGLAKVLADMPEAYKHYEEFYTTYMEMAQAIINCQQVDKAGYGFWTQSMLQDYPKGSNGNDEGYETSGTAFFVYGLFWGINNGLLDEDTYLIPAVRGWGYLENVALHEDGRVGYVQPIGANATEAVGYNTTANFGVGAYLLAAAESARWAQNN